MLFLLAHKSKIVLYVGRKDKYEEMEMEDEEFVDPQKKAKYIDKNKEKDEDLESEQSLDDTSDADEVSYNIILCSMGS